MFRGIVNWLSRFDVAARREGGLLGKGWRQRPHISPLPQPFLLAREVSVIARGKVE